VDVASFFLAHRENPNLTFSEFVLSRQVQFKALVPAEKTEPEFLVRYPWMKRQSDVVLRSWEIGFTSTGHVVSFTPSSKVVNQATVSHIRPAELISGNGNEVALTRDGSRLVSLILDDFPVSN
jgi:hypothetical protein